VAGGGATAWGPWGELETSARRLRVVPEADDAAVFLDGRPYRGRAEVVHLPDGTLTVASRVEREAYLASVVSSELGGEGLEAFEAARAQAVAARSYTVFVAESGLRDSLGVDLVADPEVDQSYPGRLAEREAGRRAVAETRGRVLVRDGSLALAFYHSTCGGRTVRPEEIWEEEPRPYLRSVVDAPGGDAEAEDYCAASPHHRWSRGWTAREVDEAVRPAAARAAGLDPADLGAVRSVEATARTEHGRVTELTVVAERAAGGAADTLRFGTREIPGVLASPGGEALRSTWFEVVDPPEEGGLAVEGRGSGHGVGMCQWGAVERARRGAGWREILETYYPGTGVQRLEEVRAGRLSPSTAR
jgi:stage II sporulation protein D